MQIVEKVFGMSSENLEKSYEKLKKSFGDIYSKFRKILKCF